MLSERVRNRRGRNSRTLATLAMTALLLSAGLGGLVGCGTGIYQDFTDAINGCCCDDDDCDDCDDCGDWGYDDCYWGDCGGCYWGDCGDWGFDFGFGWFDPGYPYYPYW